MLGFERQMQVFNNAVHKELSKEFVNTAHYGNTVWDAEDYILLVQENEFLPLDVTGPEIIQKCYTLDNYNPETQSCQWEAVIHYRSGKITSVILEIQDFENKTAGIIIVTIGPPKLIPERAQG